MTRSNTLTWQWSPAWSWALPNFKEGRLARQKRARSSEKRNRSDVAEAPLQNGNCSSYLPAKLLRISEANMSDASFKGDCCEGNRPLTFSRRYFMKQGGIAMVGLSTMPGFLQRAIASTPSSRQKHLVLLFQHCAP